MNPNFVRNINVAPRENDNEKVCIVYLEVTKKVEDGVYDAYVDFRRVEDVAYFKQVCDEAGDFGQRNTYLHLLSFKSAKRLMRGCYYALSN